MTVDNALLFAADNSNCTPIARSTGVPADPIFPRITHMQKDGPGYQLQLSGMDGVYPQIF